MRSDIHGTLRGHNHESSLLFVGGCVCVCAVMSQEKWCLSGKFSELGGHCYFGLFVCVHSGMHLCGLLCFKWSVMRVG